MKFESS
jgi:hypothetical protein